MSARPGGEFLDWALVVARVSEGHCGECAGRLRGITAEEQPEADAWHSEPFAVCTACHAVHTRLRPGQPVVFPTQDDPFNRICSSISWNVEHNTADPFRLVRDGCMRCRADA